MAKVSKADWGARANIYLYRVEPMIDRTRSGENKFVNVYAEPVSEDRIMADYGSGRYKLILNFRKPGAETGDLIDSMYMDILNMKYPPKIPLGEWVDDPRNKKWAWAKEAGQGPVIQQQAPATGVETFVDVLRATGDIRREIREEMQDNAPAQQPPAAVDPWSAAEKILNMRSENPMVAILQQQMKDAAAATEAERQRAFTAAEAARDREFKLQEQLLASRSVPQKGLLDQLLELAALGDKLDPLKKMFGFGNGTAELAGRAARTTGLDVVRDLVTGPAGERLAQGIGVLIGNLASATTPNGKPPATVLPNPALNNGAMPPQETTEERINRIGETVTRPMLAEYFMKNASGAEWAQAMFDLWPEDYVFMRTLGAENLVNRYRRYPQAWNIIAYREADFITFITEFCAWDPNTEDAPAPPDNGDDGVVDLDPDKPEATA
jgi:hypothetical protein